MFDCAQDIRNYHDEAVKLSEDTRGKLRECRNANRDRLKENLKEKKKPSPLRFQKQGSYAMRTTIQEANNAYDIDDGVIFAKDDLKGDRGGDMTSLEARQMVCDALQDKRFNKKPEVLKNCVRVHYNDGHHVDVPVYRESGDEKTGFKCEIASSEWKESNPAEINEWFDGQLDKKRSDQDDADPQMRRMIRLLKRYATSRASWNLPSGFILTILLDEKYSVFDERDDQCFYNLIVAIKNRLLFSLVVKNPVHDEILTNGNPDPKMESLRDKLGEAIEKLKVLFDSFDSKCTRPKALKAWADVFNTDYFDADIEECESKTSFVITGEQPNDPVHKAGGGRFG
jgi:Second Messenger Oligonucleotide or Dinucleotide Synthetase domain